MGHRTNGADPVHDGTLAELARLEPIFHHVENGTSREDFDRITDPDFWEIGASGRRYGREQIWSVLEERYSSADHVDEWTTTEFWIRELAPDTYLLTYTLAQKARITRRATLWQRHTDGWKILYHQGTPVSVT